jgi:ABC-type uncharacterized transport system substrate-binding protein
MRRRDFIAGLCGAAAWPLAALAQRADRVRRIGVLMPYDENDAQTQGWLSGFTQGVAGLGWTDVRTVRIDIRWAAGNLDRMAMFAKELADLQPDVIFAVGTPAGRNLVVVYVVDARRKTGGSSQGYQGGSREYRGECEQVFHERSPLLS